MHRISFRWIQHYGPGFTWISRQLIHIIWPNQLVLKQKDNTSVHLYKDTNMSSCHGSHNAMAIWIPVPIRFLFPVAQKQISELSPLQSVTTRYTILPFQMIIFPFLSPQAILSDACNCVTIPLYPTCSIRWFTSTSMQNDPSYIEGIKRHQCKTLPGISKNVITLFYVWKGYE